MSYGHLQSVLPEVALDSFSTCAAAANCIAQYLESYNRIHSFKFAPFFLFYASYVSATIHVRIAAQRHLNSDAFACLRTCLLVFDQNELNNPAVKKAKAVIQQLMDRMGVKSPDDPDAMGNMKTETWPPFTFEQELGNERIFASTTPQMNLPQEWNINDLDFEAILQSFSRPYPSAGEMYTPHTNFMTSQEEMMTQGVPWSNSNTNQPTLGSFDYMNQFGGGNMGDVLFGFDVSTREDDW